MTTNKEVLRNHANRNIFYILDHLGLPFTDRGPIIQSFCPCNQHGGDRNNTSAFSWKADIGRWMCWSHHCEEKYGSDIFGLVRSIKDLSFQDSINWVEKLLLDKNIDLEQEVVITRHVPQLHVHKPLPENNLKFLMSDPQYLLNRGFSQPILRRYEIGLWSRIGTYMHDRVIFPIRDQDNY